MFCLRFLALTIVFCVIIQHHVAQSAPSPQDFSSPTSNFVSRFMTNLSEYVRNLIHTAGNTASNAIGGAVGSSNDFLGTSAQVRVGTNNLETLS